MKGLFIILMFPFVLFSNNEEQKTTLIVSSSGKTIEEAKDNALRSAIEQSFGAFISSKTEVLNDEIKDEIISISNGNIHNYKIISQVEIPDGGYAITLEATISVTQLTSFVRNKGIEVEFKGSLFGAEIKQQKLNQNSEIKAIRNICNVGFSLLKASLDYNLEVSEPEMFSGKIASGYTGGLTVLSSDDWIEVEDHWLVNLKVIINTNDNYEAFKKYFFSNLENLAISKNEIEKYEQRKIKHYQLEIVRPFQRIERTEKLRKKKKKKPSNLDSVLIISFRSSESMRMLQRFFTLSNSLLVSFNISNDIDTIVVTDYDINYDYPINNWDLNTYMTESDRIDGHLPGFPNFFFPSFFRNNYMSSWRFYLEKYDFVEGNNTYDHFKEKPYFDYHVENKIGTLHFDKKEFLHRYNAVYSEDQIIQISKFKINKNY